MSFKTPPHHTKAARRPEMPYSVTLATSTLIFFWIQIFILPQTVAQTVVNYQPETQRISNPERGFYRYIETRSSNPSPYSQQTLVQYREEQDITLLYCITYLDTFVESVISDDFLTHIDQNFNTVREAGLKCIVRFAYTSDDPTTRNETPPFGDATKSQVLAHIEQLGPLLEKHADVIAVMQAGFIGVWGEWYYTDHFVDNPSIPWEISAAQHTNRLEVVQALLNWLPNTHQVSVRYPHAKQGMLQSSTPITENEAFTPTNQARISFHNDCFLAGTDDFGTYRNNDDRTYLANESQFLAVGGESCTRNLPRSECDNALQELSEYHWSYINAEYHPDVLNDWASQGCMAEIEKRVGYQISLTKGTFPASVTAGSELAVLLELENTGWAAPIKDRPLQLIASHTATGNLYRATLPDDIRRWYAGSSFTVDQAICTTPTMPAGNYHLSLYLPDALMPNATPPAYALRLANQNLWDSATGFNDLQHVVQLTSGPANCTSPLVFIADDVTSSISHELPLSLEWALYPNPTTDFLTIQVKDLPGHLGEIQIFNSLGQLQGNSTHVLRNSKASIDVSHLPAGVYFIRLTSENTTTYRKFTHLNQAR